MHTFSIDTPEFASYAKNYTLFRCDIPRSTLDATGMFENTEYGNIVCVLTSGVAYPATLSFKRQPISAAEHSKIANMYSNCHVFSLYSTPEHGICEANKEVQSKFAIDLAVVSMGILVSTFADSPVKNEEDNRLFRNVSTIYNRGKTDVHRENLVFLAASILDKIRRW